MSRLSIATLLFATTACGLISSNEPDREDDPNPEICDDGRMRLGEAPCESGELIVEECRDGEWIATSECATPDECEEGATIELDELCSDEWFNRKTLVCSGNLLQEGDCTCGSAEPINVGKGDVATQKDADAIANVPYPHTLVLLNPDVTGLSGVRCARQVFLYEGESPLDGLVAAWYVSVEGEGPFGFDSLIRASSISICVEREDLEGLGSVQEAGFLSIGCDHLVRLDGLNSLEDVGRLRIEGPSSLVSIASLKTLQVVREEIALVGLPSLESLEGLTGLVNVAGNVSLAGLSAVRDLSGLRNLTTVEGDFSLGIGDEALLVNLDGLANLEVVGGNFGMSIPVSWNFRPPPALKKVGSVSISVPYVADSPTPDWEEECAIWQSFQGIEIQGEFEIRGVPFDASVCAPME